MKRLYDSDKVEIAEHASFGRLNDERLHNVPWRVYANAVDEKDPRYKTYNSNPNNAFGEWRWEKVNLDFKPDCVWSCKDPWMYQFILRSPLRPFYHVLLCPTVDSEPYQKEWIDDLLQADGVLAYTDWGINVLNRQGFGHINTIRSAPAGINTHTFSPVQSKVEQKKKMLFQPDINLVGFVARNQVRKLYPDLFIAFEKFLKLCHDRNNEELARKTYLFCHTSYPDVGWNIPQLLKERPISHKVLFSYICKKCGGWFPAFFNGAIKFCPSCKELSACMPNVKYGISDEQLAEVYKCLDLYVQYSNSEGIGMPPIEAASCGVPIMEVDATAMSDVVRKLGGIPLKVERVFREVGTGANRVYPDNDYCAEKIYEVLTNEELKTKLGHNARKGVLQNYTWDKTAQTYIDYFDNCKLTGLQGKWNAPPRFLQPNVEIDIANMGEKQFVELLSSIMGHNSTQIENLRLLTQLHYGAEVQGRSIQKMNREKALNDVLRYVNGHNLCEEVRCGFKTLDEEDFLQYANIRDRV